MLHSSVIYGKEKISFRVLHGARKTLGIEVYPDGSVMVKAPAGTDSKEILNRANLPHDIFCHTSVICS